MQSKKVNAVVMFILFGLFIYGCGDGNKTSSNVVNPVTSTPINVPDISSRFPKDLNKPEFDLPKVNGNTGNIKFLLGAVQDLSRKKDWEKEDEAKYKIACYKEAEVMGYVIKIYYDDNDDGDWQQPLQYGQVYLPRGYNDSISGIKVGNYSLSIYTFDKDYEILFRANVNDVHIEKNIVTNVTAELELAECLNLESVLDVNLGNFVNEEGYYYNITAWQGAHRLAQFEGIRYSDANHTATFPLYYCDLRNEERKVEITLYKDNRLLKVMGCVYNLNNFHNGIVPLVLDPNRKEGEIIIRPQFNSKGDRLYEYFQPQIKRISAKLISENGFYFEEERSYYLNLNFIKEAMEDSISGFPVGRYKLECWATNQDGNDIFRTEKAITISESSLSEVNVELELNDPLILISRISNIELDPEIFYDVNIWEGHCYSTYGSYTDYDDANHSLELYFVYDKPFDVEKKVEIAISGDDVLKKIVACVYKVEDIINYGFVPLMPDPNYQGGTLATRIGFAHDKLMGTMEKDSSIPDGIEYILANQAEFLWKFTAGPYENIRFLHFSLYGEDVQYLKDIEIYCNNRKVGDDGNYEDGNTIEVEIDKTLSISAKGKAEKINIDPNTPISFTLHYVMEGVETGKIYSGNCAGQTFSIVPRREVLIEQLPMSLSSFLAENRVF